MRFREHRGTLAEASKTLVELKDRDALIERCKEIYSNIYQDGCVLDPAKLRARLYAYGMPDDRIGWKKTYLVYVVDAKGASEAILGFTDSPVSA